MKNQEKCPHCKSEEVVKRGHIQTKISGQKQRYFCKSCNRKELATDLKLNSENKWLELINLTNETNLKEKSLRGVEEKC